MKKIITKISLLPLLTLFTKKKTVRSRSDIKMTAKKTTSNHEKKMVTKRKNYRTMSSSVLYCEAQQMSMLLESANTTPVLINLSEELRSASETLNTTMLNYRLERISASYMHEAKQRLAICLESIERYRRIVPEEYSF